MKKYIPILILLVLLSFTRIAWAQELRGSNTRDVELPCLPSHGWNDNESAWCGEESSMQTVALAMGNNWVSFYIDTNLEALQASLLEALPNATSITIKSQRNGQTSYNGTRWRGALNTLDVALMYKIEIPESCEITLEGMHINPAEHPITIKNGPNWIGFPFSETMTPSDAFAGFAINGDMIRSKNQQANYNGTSWRGALNTLVPGQGYIYNSTATEDRTFTFPTTAK